MKTVKQGNNLTVILDDGEILYSSNCNDDLFNEIMQAILVGDEDLIRELVAPETAKTKKKCKRDIQRLKDYSNSQYLSVVGNSIFIRSISELTVPLDLAKALYKAERKGKTKRVKTYLNFWTLCSLNPDSRARANMFWFLDKYGMKISRSGLFVAYRNVDIKEEGIDIDSKLAKYITKFYTKVKFEYKKSPRDYFLGYVDDPEGKCSTKLEVAKREEDFVQVLGNLQELYDSLQNEDTSPTFTDQHSHSFRIKIGVPVTMPRSKCDSVQENTCSRGLHVAGKNWLGKWYFGGTTLKVLVNPADVVAVPPLDGYGKMRTCAYYPMEIIEWSDEGQMMDTELKDGFEDDFINMITYQGEINNNDQGNYRMEIPNIPEVSRETILANLEEIRKLIKKKTC